MSVFPNFQSAIVIGYPKPSLLFKVCDQVQIGIMKHGLRRSIMMLELFCLQEASQAFVCENK